MRTAAASQVDREAAEKYRPPLADRLRNESIARECRELIHVSHFLTQGDLAGACDSRNACKDMAATTASHFLRPIASTWGGENASCPTVAITLPDESTMRTRPPGASNP